MRAEKALRRALEGLLNHLMIDGRAADCTAVVAEHVERGFRRITRLTWQDARTEVFHMSGGLFREYLWCVEHRQYSALLNDGAFIQVSYDLEESALVGHRLVFWPSPFATLDLAEHAERGAWDTIQGYAEALLGYPEEMRLAGPWRFDFDPDSSSDTHPGTHLTVIHKECRLPGTRALDLRRFCVLVFRHLWPLGVEDCEEWADDVPRVPAAGAFGPNSFVHMHWSDHVRGSPM